MSEYKPGRGLDVGTSQLVMGRSAEDGRVSYTEVRDCFFRLEPKTSISRKIIEKGLKGQTFFKDGDAFVVVGQDAIERAIERNQSTFRPMVRGVFSPKERRARAILRFILSHILGEPQVKSEHIVYSIPSQPMDLPRSQFDISFHEDALSNDMAELGYHAEAIPEAEAVCYSELRDDGYTGIGMSFGAGMVNTCLMSSGEGILHWSTTRSGDWIDRMASVATDTPDTVIQVEKEHGKFVVGQESSDDPIMSAIAIYYGRLVDYTVKAMASQLMGAAALPKFKDPIPLVLSGGTALASGFLEAFSAALDEEELPFEIKEVRLAKDPLRAVARGCLLASELL